jgi:hypothetical protein
MESAAVAAGHEGVDWGAWARRLLVCNPFFLYSAALLLFGVNRLSTDDRLFASDLHNLFFNFFSLQLYEVALVLTAVVLARRRVWYDSALLVVVENGLLLVPFMLISQASLEGMSYGWTFSAAGGLLAAARFGSIRRWYREFRLPGRALALGAAVLLFNVALPLIFRPMMEKDVEDWRGPNELIWMVLLPLVALGANLLPRPETRGPRPPERPWLPLLMHGLWTAGTAVHVWSIAHICGLPLEARHLAPTASVALWSLSHRLTDCVALPSGRLQAAVLLLTGPAPLLAFGHPAELLSLGAVHLVAYVWIGWNGRAEGEVRSVARQLALSTIALGVAGLPLEWVSILPRPLGRDQLIAGALACYLLLQALASRRAELGLIGALVAGIAPALILRPESGHAVFQVAAVFLLVHSLRWNDDAQAGAGFLRWVGLLSWLAEAIGAARTGGAWDPVCTIGAIGVLVAWTVVFRLTGRLQRIAMPVSALAVALASPAHWCLQHGSNGLWALAGSLLLFAAGARFAWNRTETDGSR